MRLFIVRHGQSKANVNWDENRNVADHAIDLTEIGYEQAKEAGKALAWYLENFISRFSSTRDRILPQIRLWHSPYRRARQTADAIEETCRLNLMNDDPDKDSESHVRWKIQRPNGVVTPRKAGESYFLDRREHLMLAEEQYGLFDGLSDEERATLYPAENAYYEKCKAHAGRFWAKMPLGESRFELAQRVHQAFGTFHRDAAKHGVRDLVIVAHGTVNRILVMMWKHLPFEWMENEPNPKNCSIRLLEDGADKGYIFKGFDNGLTTHVT